MRRPSESTSLPFMTRRLHTFVAWLGCWALSACASAPPPRPIELSADPPPGSEQGVQSSQTEAELRRAVAYIERGKFSDARSHIEKVVSLDSSSAQGWFYLGVIEEADKQPDKAVAAYTKALSADATLSEASLNLSAVHLEAKRYDDAVRVLEAALPGGGAERDLRQQLGFAFSLKRDFASARKHYERATAIRNDARLALDFGGVLVSLGDLEVARKVLAAGFQDAPAELPVLETYAARFAQAKGYAECVKAWDRVLALQPKVAMHHVRRGLCKHEVNDEQGALTDFQEATKIDPKFVEAHYYLGMSYVRLHKKFGATQSLFRVIELAPNTTIADKAEDQIAALEGRNPRRHPKRDR